MRFVFTYIKQISFITFPAIISTGSATAEAAAFPRHFDGAGCSEAAGVSVRPTFALDLVIRGDCI